jgi:formylglycine-generating enzyme required for sulfatase activity
VTGRDDGRRGAIVRRSLVALLLVMAQSVGAGTAAPNTQTETQTETRTATLAQQETFRDCDLCPEMTIVPAGTFMMGADDRSPAERPAHRVTIPAPFAMGRYEVTFDEFAACVAAGECPSLPHDHAWGRGRRPVVNVTYADIQAYLGWLSRVAGQTYRLPSEAEWEYANRAGTTTLYWWGDSIEAGRANCRGCGSAWDGKQTAPVGSFPPNPFGLHDTTGNVLEWVADCWNETHAGTAGDASPRRDGDCRQRVIRGGNWYYIAKVARTTWRGRNDVRANTYGIGFRVARDLR